MSKIKRNKNYSFPALELEFTKDGEIYTTDALEAICDMIKGQDLTDLIILAHGWNNDMNEAKEKYSKLTELLALEVSKITEFDHRKFGVLALFWPSKKFADEDLIPGGGAASLQTANSQQKIIEDLKNLRLFFDSDNSKKIVEQAIENVQNFNSPDSQANFTLNMDKLLKGVEITYLGEPEDQVVENFEPQNFTALLNRLSDLDHQEIKQTGGASLIKDMDNLSHNNMGAANLASFGNGLLNGARNLLNFVTYYQMKARAGNVGKRGLYPIMKHLKKDFPNAKLHLIGHSFGARLVTSSVLGENSEDGIQIDTLTLLQAAFSHYGFGESYSGDKDGVFRSIITNRKVKGPIVITHTHNDKAVGKAYAIASRIARQSGEFLGGANDFYGGMGANGAQKTPDVNNTYNLREGNSYEFKKNTVYNLNADESIVHHSDILKPIVAKVIVQAIRIS